MRIAFVASEFITETTFDGGLANYLNRISLALKEKNIDVVIFVVSDQTEKIVLNGREIIRVNVYKNFTAGIFFRLLDFLTFKIFTYFFCFLRISWILSRALKRYMRTAELDIIQYNSLGGIGFFRLRKVPAVIRISSYTPLSWEKGGYEGYSKRNIMQQAFIESLSLKKADGVFGPGKRNLDIIAKENKIANLKLIESPFLLQETGQQAEIPQQLSGKKYLLFFGTLNKLKGILLLSEIIDKILAVDNNLFFVFIGKEQKFKDKPMLEYVYEKAAENSARIIYFGSLKHNELFPIIKKSEAVVLPSLVDNFPNACLEAMGNGAIVIGPDNTSFEQIIDDKINGFLFNAGDSTDLFNTIYHVLHMDNSEKLKIRENAVKRIGDFSEDVILPKLIDYYKSILGNKNCK